MLPPENRAINPGLTSPTVQRDWLSSGHPLNRNLTNLFLRQSRTAVLFSAASIIASVGSRVASMTARE